MQCPIRSNPKGSLAGRPVARWRAGMSMLELMLVLALLVAVSALSLPSFRGSFDNHRLRKAGELVQVQFNKARIKAMKTGQIHQFQYDPEQNTFAIVPYYQEQDTLELDATGEMAMRGTLNAASSLTASTMSEPKSLPEGVAFAAAQVASDMRSLQTQQQSQLQNALPIAAQQTALVLFYPDGTTSDARITLTNQQHSYVIVTLRSLTGLATVGDVMAENVYQQQL